MKRADFNHIVDKTLNSCADILVKKGSEYSGEEDVLANFKRQAAELNLSPLQILSVYRGKHEDSIKSLVNIVCKANVKYDLTNPKDIGESKVVYLQKALNKASSEPFAERIKDDINYLLLLLALMNETTGKIDDESPKTLK